MLPSGDEDMFEKHLEYNMLRYLWRKNIEKSYKLST